MVRVSRKKSLDSSSNKLDVKATTYPAKKRKTVGAEKHELSHNRTEPVFAEIHEPSNNHTETVCAEKHELSHNRTEPVFVEIQKPSNNHTETVGAEMYNDPSNNYTETVVVEIHEPSNDHTETVGAEMYNEPSNNYTETVVELHEPNNYYADNKYTNYNFEETTSSSNGNIQAVIPDSDPTKIPKNNIDFIPEGEEDISVYVISDDEDENTNVTTSSTDKNNKELQDDENNYEKTAIDVKSEVIPSDNDTYAQELQPQSIIVWNPLMVQPTQNELIVVYDTKMCTLPLKLDTVTTYSQPTEDGNETFWQNQSIEQEQQFAELESETENKVSGAGVAQKSVQGIRIAADNYNGKENGVIEFETNNDVKKVIMKGRWESLLPIASEVVQKFFDEPLKGDRSNKDNVALTIKELSDINENKDNIESATKHKINRDTEKSKIKKVDVEAEKSKSSIRSSKDKLPEPKKAKTLETKTDKKHKSKPVPKNEDEEVKQAKERVKQLEEKIFKEIEEKDKLHKSKTTEDKSSKRDSDSHVHSSHRKRKLPRTSSPYDYVVDNEKSSSERSKKEARSKSTKRSSDDAAGAGGNAIVEDASTLLSPKYKDGSRH